jgi:hypothetical protein
MDPSNVDPRDNSPETRPVSSDAEKQPSISRISSEESLGTQQRGKARAEKAAAIHRACDAGDVEALVSYATSEGGLLEDELRQRACTMRKCHIQVEPE